MSDAAHDRAYYDQMFRERGAHYAFSVAVDDALKLRAALERARPYLVDHVAMTADSDDLGDRLALDAVDAAMEHEHGGPDCYPGSCPVAEERQRRDEEETIARSGEDDGPLDDEPRDPDLPPEWGPRYGPNRKAP